MGGSVSAGRNNDELIDHLVEAEFIRTPLIQRVFRAVDRGNYYIVDEKQNAYKDIAWRAGNFHISAPCVYSAVMEALKLRAGLSFLNLGSGTGYLSTMAGLLLGPYGTNHGVELYSDVIDFAYERLDDFLKSSHAVDEFDFCEPSFMPGNCLWLDCSCQQYDRVYCGASCPPEYDHYIKNLIKVGGILIMPSNEKLLKITRTSETTWNTVKLLSVSFAPLICPTGPVEPSNHVKLGDVCPPKLQHICRSTIRFILRKNVDAEQPNLLAKTLKKERRPRRQVRRIVIPFFDESDSQSNSDLEYDSDSPEFHISSHLPSHMSVFLEDFLRRHAELQLLRSMEEQILSDSDTEQQPEAIPHARGDAVEPNEMSSDSEFFSLFTVTNFRQQQQQSSDEESNFNQPPSASTRSKRKRKHSATNGSGASTSAGASSSEPKLKVKRTAATVYWKKRVAEKKEKEEAKKADQASDDESYTSSMVQKIGALPLPPLILRYLNYKRDNL